MSAGRVCRVCGLDSRALGQAGRWWASDPDGAGLLCSGCRGELVDHPSRYAGVDGMPEDPWPDLTLLELPVLRLPYSLRSSTTARDTRVTLVEVLERRQDGDPSRVRIIA